MVLWNGQSQNVTHGACSQGSGQSSAESRNMLSWKGLISFWDFVFKNGMGLGLNGFKFHPRIDDSFWGWQPYFAYENKGGDSDLHLFPSLSSATCVYCFPPLVLGVLNMAGMWVRSLTCPKDISSKTNLVCDFSHFSWNTRERSRPVQLEMAIKRGRLWPFWSK